MRKRPLIATAGLAISATVLAGIGLAPAARGATAFEIDAGALRITVDDEGVVTSLESRIDGSDYTASGQAQPLIRLLADEAPQEPTSLSFDAGTSTYEFDFGGTGVTVDITVEAHPDYSTFEVTDITAPSGVDVEALLWGPIPTSITRNVGETVGVVYDEGFAIGIHALNNKTIGGWPLELDALGEPGGPGPNRMDYHMGAASRTTWGSVLQAYSWDYTKPRTRTIGIPGVPGQYMHDQPVPVLAGPEGELVGSKVAMFGSWRPRVLPVLERIQLDQGLYHGTIDGKWQKTAQETTASFLVLQDITAANIAQAAGYANQAGLDYIYSLEGVGGPWVSDGHYAFKPGLGGADANVASAVATAEGLGVAYGAHTLSGFIESHDAYVRPVPDPGLARAGSATLSRPLDSAATSTDVYVTDDAPFRNAHGSIVQVDSELISFSTVTAVGPGEYRLSGGSRGVWGTTRASHASSAEVSRLWVNQYGGALAGHGLVDDVSLRLATAWNATGTRAMSFDGLEGTYNSEYGPYDLFTLISNMLDNIDDKDGFLTEASMMAHNQWDMQSRVSWGESYTSMGTRYSNMTYMRRNFLPAMIGWLYLNNYGSVRQLEFDLSKMAAWNAGSGFQSTVSQLGTKAAYLDKIRIWEDARNRGAFSMDQRTRMMDTGTYWTLSEVQAGVSWSLQQTDAEGNAIGSAESVFVGNTAGSRNAAEDDPVTFSGPTVQSTAYANDGDATSTHRWVGLTDPGTGWMQIDLGAPTTINQIKLWQYYGNGRTYHDVVVQLSDDPDFDAARTVTVFNNDTDDTLGLGAGTDEEYAETSAGKSMRVDEVTARYVRFWANGSTTNSYNSWVEAQVFESPRNLAAGIQPTFSGAIAQSASFATDGSTDSNAWVGLTASGTGWVQLDLQSEREIDKIKLWQYWANGRTYHDVVVEVSNDPTFGSGVTTVFNNDADNSSGRGAGVDAEYAETSGGKTIPVGVNARYVRFWANGSTSNAYNSWVELQVFGY